MPRGIPKAGYRKRKSGAKKRVAAVAAPKKSVYVSKTKVADFGFEPDTGESDHEIFARLHERFSVLEDLADQATSGNCRAMIVSGPAGLGKSYTIEKKLAEWDPTESSYTIVKGYVKATGLYKLLWKHRDEGQVIVFDDADSIFYDDISLNFLKAVCDTTESRRINYLSEGKMYDDDEQEIPSRFDFNGTIIFITNLDFDKLIARGHKLAPHLQALISRALYLDLTMKTRRDYLIRIRQVIKEGLLAPLNLSESEHDDVVKFIETNSNSLRELSLRVALKVGALRKSRCIRWHIMAKTTCCRPAA